VAEKKPAAKKEKAPKKETGAILTLDGREVRISNPDKPYFSRDVKLSKLDVVRYYLSVAGGAVAGIRDRPSMLKRFVDGAEKPPFYQKRAPENRPEWLRTVTLSFPSGRAAPTCGANQRSRSSRRAAHRPRSDTWRRVG